MHKRQAFVPHCFGGLGIVFLALVLSVRSDRRPQGGGIQLSIEEEFQANEDAPFRDMIQKSLMGKSHAHPLVSKKCQDEVIKKCPDGSNQTAPIDLVASEAEVDVVMKLSRIRKTLRPNDGLTQQTFVASAVILSMIFLADFQWKWGMDNVSFLVGNTILWGVGAFALFKHALAQAAVTDLPLSPGFLGEGSRLMKDSLIYSATDECWQQFLKYLPLLAAATLMHPALKRLLRRSEMCSPDCRIRIGWMLDIALGSTCYSLALGTSMLKVLVVMLAIFMLFHMSWALARKNWLGPESVGIALALASPWIVSVAALMLKITPDLGSYFICLRGISYVQDSFTLHRSERDDERPREGCCSILCNEVLSYSAYMLYPALFAAGPVIKYQDFIAHYRKAFRAHGEDTPTATPLSEQCAAYGLSLIGQLILFETMQHAIYPSVLAHMAVKGVGLPPGLFALFGMMIWLIQFTFFKLCIIWRVARLWAVMDGIFPPEECTVAIGGHATVRDFWRTFHASFNKWLVQYIFLPLGGRNRVVLSVTACFCWVLFCHDPLLEHPEKYCVGIGLFAAGYLTENQLISSGQPTSMLQFMIRVKWGIVVLLLLIFGNASAYGFNGVNELVKVFSVAFQASTSMERSACMFWLLGSLTLISFGSLMKLESRHDIVQHEQDNWMLNRHDQNDLDCFGKIRKSILAYTSQFHKQPLCLLLIMGMCIVCITAFAGQGDIWADMSLTEGARHVQGAPDHYEYQACERGRSGVPVRAPSNAFSSIFLMAPTVYLAIKGGVSGGAHLSLNEKKCLPRGVGDGWCFIAQVAGTLHIAHALASFFYHASLSASWGYLDVSLMMHTTLAPAFLDLLLLPHLKKSDCDIMSIEIFKGYDSEGGRYVAGTIFSYITFLAVCFLINFRGLFHHYVLLGELVAGVIVTFTMSWQLSVGPTRGVSAWEYWMPLLIGVSGYCMKALLDQKLAFGSSFFKHIECHPTSIWQWTALFHIVGSVALLWSVALRCRLLRALAMETSVAFNEPEEPEIEPGHPN